MLSMFIRTLPCISKVLNTQAMLRTACPALDLEMDRLVWIDMEMSGLNVETDKILEIACLVTDSNLNIIAESPDIVIKQPLEVLNGMDEWCTRTHTKSGLYQQCLDSQVTEQVAESQIMEFLKKYVSPNSSPLTGNSVYMDRLFLVKNMPSIHNYLHYRIVDVSGVKELCRRWNEDVHRSQPKKLYTHRALDDIRESVQELKYYKENFFKAN